VYRFTSNQLNQEIAFHSCDFAVITLRNVCGSTAQSTYKLRGCNVYGVVARVIITGLGIGIGGLKEISVYKFDFLILFGLSLP